MPFNSSAYAIFLLVVFALFWLNRGKLRITHFILLLCSYYFYASWNVKYLGLILFVTVLNFVIGLLLDRESRDSVRKWYLALSLIGSLGVLAIFKYHNFASHELSRIFEAQSNLTLMRECAIISWRFL